MRSTDALPPNEAQFVSECLTNRHNRAILEAWDRLALPDAWLVAGCLFQTVWNLREGRAPEAGIKDYDLFYFDASDLSAEAEGRVQQRVEALLGHLGVALEAKNQARVHTWYEDWFGYPYAPLRSSRDGIGRFLVPCTCVGLRPSAQRGYEVHAPYGLDELYAGRLRPNPLLDHRPLFLAKAASYQSRWAWLEIDEQRAGGGERQRGAE